MKAVFVSILAALVLGGCGAVAGGAAQPTSSPSTDPGARFDITATENTRSVALRVGQTLAVVLHARAGMTDWSGVNTSDKSVLAPIVNPAASAARGVTVAGFKAIAPGKVRVIASAGPLCSPDEACPAYRMVLTIDVTVMSG